MFAALVFVTTFVTKIPVPVAGYANLGDAVIIISAILLGPYFGMASAAIGASMADIIAGYAIYAPMTFFIKAIMGLAVGLIAYKSKKFLLKGIISAIVSEIIMVAGYFAFEWIFMGFAVGTADVIPNTIQGTVCAVASSLCIVLFYKNSAIREFIAKL